ncbi:MAG TPA: carboxypeptidase regulatory-like domain-containing protein [Gemmatimonadaceae bacterium]
MIPFRRLPLLAAITTLFAASAHAQSELKGRVVSDSGKPIAGAVVTLTSVRYSVQTDSLGRFQLAGTPGSTLGFTLQAEGYREENATVVLSRGRPVVRDFVLSSEAIPVPEVNPSDRVLRVNVITADGEPLAYANVVLNGGRRLVSDDSGRIALPARSGPLTLLVRRIGYEPNEVRLAERPDTAVRVRMTAVARTLETQQVTVRSPFVRLDLSGFYRRMAEVENGARVGYFVTPEDLALRNPQNVTDAVEQFPSIRLRPIDDGKVDAFGLNHGDGVPLSRKFRIEDRSGCPLTVYLDRVRIQPSISGGKVVDEEINSIIQPQNVAGIEVYPRALGAPAEYPAFQAHGGTCGIVLIWTK